MRATVSIPRVLAVALCLSSAVASAQSSTASQASFNPQLFHPAPGPSDFVTVEAAQPLHHKAVGAGLYVDYGRNALSILTYSSRTLDAYGTKVQIQQHTIAAELWVGIGLWERFQISLSLPMTLYQSGQNFDGDYPGPDGIHIRAPRGFALGDPRLNLKVRLYGSWRGPQLAISHWLSVPVGNQNALGGEPHYRGFAGEPRLLGEWIGDRWRAGLSVGFAWRAQTSRYYTAGAGQQLTYGAAFAFDAVRKRLRLIAELYGHHDFGDVDYTAASPLEIDVSARVFAGIGISVTVGVGGGVIEGVGAPAPRVFVGVAYEPALSDRDQDGIPDGFDKCPDVAEDRDGYQDQDGCPDLDDDGDGIPDAQDRCPRVAEDFDRFQDDDGCPEADNDKDGILDINDACPNDAEDGLGPRPKDGCPAGKTDQDGDGVPDSLDKCPTEPEDVDGWQDEDGCPDPDNDDDGIPDGFDECPNLAEDMDGVDDEDGCPDGAGAVKIIDGDFKLKTPIAIDGSAPSVAGAQLVDLIAKIMVGRPTLELRIEGYWDKKGGAAIGASQTLADAVKNRLIAHGVDARRLVAVGYGTAGGTKRVELHIVKARPATKPARQEPGFPGDEVEENQ